jgi:acyl-coenzyme A thioesterase PaaI-like protein
VSADGAGRHILRELGFATRREGDEMHGTALITPEMHVPGRGHLRTSILATWADNLAGLLAVDAMAPRVPVTLELDVHLYRPAPARA